MSVAAGGWVDLHSHLVPEVDDGSSGVDESLEAIDRLVDEGVTAIVTTPHVSASLLARPGAADEHLGRIESAWRRVRDAWRGDGPIPRLGRGTEVLLDLPRPDVGDPRCRIEGGRYVLVEFPHAFLPPGSEDALYHIGGQEAVPVVAHVERYNFGVGGEAVWTRWRDAGGVFQVNLASFAGRYGKRVHDTAWKLLEGGWVDLLGSDYHARGNPWIREGIDALRERGVGDRLRILYGENPARILDGDEPLEVPPLEGRADRSRGRVRGFLRRMTGRDG